VPHFAIFFLQDLQPVNPLSILALKTERNPIFVKTNKSSIMKRRVRKIANFFAFNLLFFALYLNFVHKDQSAMNSVGQVAITPEPAAFSGTTVQLNNQPATSNKQQGTASSTGTEAQKEALKLSVN
jgi:hypothetical protein